MLEIIAKSQKTWVCKTSNNYNSIKDHNSNEVTLDTCDNRGKKIKYYWNFKYIKN